MICGVIGVKKANVEGKGSAEAPGEEGDESGKLVCRRHRTQALLQPVLGDQSSHPAAVPGCRRDRTDGEENPSSQKGSLCWQVCGIFFFFLNQKHVSIKNKVKSFFSTLQIN